MCKILITSKVLFIAVILSFMVGCGDAFDPFPQTVNIDSLKISPSTLNPAIDNGDFTTEWVISSEGSLGRLSYYLSKDENLFTGAADDDIRIYTVDNAANTALVPCNFGSDNVISCGTNSQLYQEDLTTWLTALPISAYIIVNTCVDLFDCDVKAFPVTFQ